MSYSLGPLNIFVFCASAKLRLVGPISIGLLLSAEADCLGCGYWYFVLTSRYLELGYSNCFLV